MKEKKCQKIIGDGRTEMLERVFSRYQVTVSVELAKLREQINRVSSSSRSDVIGLQKDQAKLEFQNSCAARGHRIVLEKAWDEPDTTAEYRFQCTDCEVAYVKRDDQLTIREKAIVKAFDMP